MKSSGFMFARSSGIRVCKVHGEKSIILAGKLKLLERRLEIKQFKNFVYVPLGRQPSDSELEEFLSQAPGAKTSTYLFRETARRAPTLFDLLDGKMTPSLLASLPRSADIVGNVIIVEISTELEAYRTLIGEALLKLHGNARTVLAKAGAVSGDYRLREFSVIAGKPDTTTVHKEYGCQYYVDLARAYFSPRLSFEHHRVACLVGEGETVLDMFAGVGPFAVQIARKLQSVKVYAVDANPFAVEFLKRNVRLNRVEERVVPILGDAKDVVKQRLFRMADRVIMNLPERATEFVCAACEALKPAGGIVHFYGFARVSDSLEIVQVGFAQAVELCGRRVKRLLCSKFVRATAPHEWQFVLDAEIA